MALTFGNTSKLFIGKQSAPLVKTPWADYSNKVYQFASGGLGVTGDYTTPDVNTGTNAPIVPILGQLGTEGSLTLPLDTKGMGLWLEQLMLATPATVEVLATPYELRAATDFNDGTAITNFTANMQPKDHLPGLPDSQAGVNCGRIIFAFESTVRAESDGGQIVVRGYDQGLVRPLIETISVTDTAAIGNKTTTNAFAEVTSVTLTGFQTTGEVTITVDPAIYKHTFEVGDALTNGLTVEMVKGTVPSTYQDVHVSEGTITVGDTNETDLTFLGGQAYQNENADGGSAASPETGKTRQPGQASPGWSAVARFDDRIVEIGEGSVSINHSLGRNENSFARQVYLPLPVITGKREVTLSTRVSYPMTDMSGNDFDIVSYAYGRNMAISLEVASMRAGALHNSLRVELPSAQLTTFPDPADIGQGQINLSLDFTAFSSEGNTDLRIIAINEETQAQFIS